MAASEPPSSILEAAVPTTTTNTTTIIQPPSLPSVLGPLLPALPAAALSTKPADSVLQLLSPILRQRVQLLAASVVAEPPSSSGAADSNASTSSANQQQQQQDETPWIRLLSYSPTKAAQLQATAQSAALELHPVSGEVEVDWDYDAQVRYRRLDEETLQCLVAVETLGLGFRLVYCTEGWKVGEVTTVGPSGGEPDHHQAGLFTSVFGGGEGHRSLSEAEAAFKQSRSSTQGASASRSLTQQQQNNTANNDNDDDDDDDYWARYDAAGSTQATPQPPHTPAGTSKDKSGPYSNLAQLGQQPQQDNDEDDYYAQYDEVQPAMDNHDPDEEMDLPADGENAAYSSSAQQQYQHSSLYETKKESAQRSPEPEMMAHPTPSRSNSSTGSTTSVEKLEAVANRLEQSEFGVKQHVSRTMKSLYMLARASGIDRQEFERMIQTEIDMLPMMDENE